jgi:hypothetical protein
MAPVSLDLRASRASGSVVLAGVASGRFSLRTSCSALRPAGSAAGGSSPPTGASFGRNDVWLARAWISVPSTEKCSSDISAVTRGCASTAASRQRVALAHGSRSRVLVKLVASHTGVSIARPTNQRKNRLSSSCCIGCRSERMEKRA